jgi:hypothetical protein
MFDAGMHPARTHTYRRQRVTQKIAIRMATRGTKKGDPKVAFLMLQ